MDTKGGKRWGVGGGGVMNWAINQKVAGSIPCRAKGLCVLGQRTSPYLPRGVCPCNYCKLLWIRVSAKLLKI